MKFIKSYHRRQLVKRSKGSTNMPLDENSAVTVLYSKEKEFNTVKKYFTRAQGVRLLEEKRSKEQPPNSSILYKNDLNLKGEPVTSDAGLVNINCGTRQKKRNNITICKMFQRLPRPQ